MPSPARKTIKVDLGPLADKAEARVQSGAYPSISEVVREGLRALDREEAMFERILPPIDESDPEWRDHVRRKVRESLDDPRPPVPAKEAFARVNQRIAEYKAKHGL